MFPVPELSIAMIDIKIDHSGIATALQRVIQATQQRAPLMRNIAAIMADAVEENFAQEGRPKWQGLAPSTIAQRRKRGKWPGQILRVSSGGLAQSMSQHSDNDSAVVGTNKKYAAIHQFGGMAGRGRKVNIPARPFLALTAEDEREIEHAAQDYLRRIIGE